MMVIKLYMLNKIKKPTYNAYQEERTSEQTQVIEMS